MAGSWLRRVFAAGANDNRRAPAAAAPEGSGGDGLTSAEKTKGRIEAFEAWSYTDERCRTHVLHGAWVEGGNTRSFAEVRQETIDTLHLMAQSKTGKFLLQHAAQSGTLLIASARRCDDNRSYGMYVPSANVVYYNPDLTMPVVLMTLAHELTHCYQDRVSGLKSYPLRRRPEALVQFTHFIEADAFAHMAQVAKEVFLSGRRLSPRQAAVWDGFIVQSMDRLALRLPQPPKPAALRDNRQFLDWKMSDFFDAWFDVKESRGRYEASKLDITRSFEKKYAEIFHLASFRQKLNFRKIKSALRHCGRSYLDEEKPGMDLSQPRYAGLSAEGVAQVRDFYARRRWHRRQKREARRLPAYEAADVSSLAEQLAARADKGFDFVRNFLPPGGSLAPLDEKPESRQTGKAKTKGCAP